MSDSLPGSMAGKQFPCRAGRFSLPEYSYAVAVQRLLGKWAQHVWMFSLRFPVRQGKLRLLGPQPNPATGAAGG
jgi:hypothetical protein